MGLMLCSRDGTRLELDVEGYQFPADVESPLPELDLNWLVIRIKARDSEGREWAATDPSLLSSELADLAGWVSAHAAGPGAFPSIQFMEPCLWLEIDRTADSASPDSTDGNMILVVHLDFELGLPLDTQHGRVRLESPLRFHVNAEELGKAASSCQELTRAYPVRSREPVCGRELQ